MSQAPMAVSGAVSSVPVDAGRRSSAQAHFDGLARWRVWEVVFWLAWAGAYFLPDANLVLLGHVLVWGLFAMSLDVVLGFRGIATLGHAVFFGVGAYAAGFLSLWGWTEPISGLLVAGLLAGLAGVLMGRVLRGLVGISVLMVTLGLSMILYDFVQRSTELTGGADGLQGITLQPLLGLWRFDMAGRTAYVYTLVVVLLCFIALRALCRSSFGLALNLRRMVTLGAPVQRDVMLSFGISAAVAGVAGALSTQTAQFVGPEVFSFGTSADVLVMLTLGGAATLYGGLIGAAIFLMLRDLLSTLDPLYWNFWIGLLLVLMVATFRKGLLPTVLGWVSAWKRKA
jgi:branched-chain amino acid transport system permease protein